MNNLMRAIRLALRYKYSLIASITCSAMVAIFWGANITAVYPFVQIVFQDQTLHTWVDKEIETSRLELAKVEKPTADSNSTLAPADRAAAAHDTSRAAVIPIAISSMAAVVPGPPTVPVLSIIISSAALVVTQAALVVTAPYRKRKCSSPCLK